MSSDNNLQEMEAGTTQSKTAVNANAAAADPMPKLSNPGPSASVEDLGGPTPENYKMTMIRQNSKRQLLHKSRMSLTRVLVKQTQCLLASRKKKIFLTKR